LMVEFFQNNCHGGLLGNTCHPGSNSMAPVIGGITHVPINTRH
jgi:hypothetical protein